MAGVLGFEPRHDGIKIRCLTAWLYPNVKMGRLMGIEPTNAGTTIRCVNHFATIATIYIITAAYERVPQYLAGAVGIEPTPKVLETSILPLNYAPVNLKLVEGDGFEPPNPKERIYSPPRLATSLPLR